MITIFTPTYNRHHTLERLYKSLCRQTLFDFEWLVVDDGSTDNTKELFSSLSEDRFAVRYYYQENGGKHRAINKGVKLAKGEWFFVVDSDDYLTDDAISLLEKSLKDIESDERYCGVVGLKINSDYETTGTPCEYEVLDTDFLSYRTKYKIEGDRAEVIRTLIMKDYPFPEIGNENFCTEAVVLNRIALKYIARYLNIKIYICEYQKGGLTDTYEIIMTNNPQGALLYYGELFHISSLPLKCRIIYGSQYWKYYRLCKEKGLGIDLSPTISTKIVSSFAFILHKCWQLVKNRIR